MLSSIVVPAHAQMGEVASPIEQRAGPPLLPYGAPIER
jgi:hypothetical protein